MRGGAAVIAAMLLPVAAIAAPAQSADERAIVAAMTDSAAGWNAGDVDRFMNVYSTRSTASFVTREGLVRGKAAMIARYRKQYDFGDPGKRGTLSFATLDYRPLGSGHALYIARYTLTYPGGRSDTGITSLVFARESAGWKIIADQSS